MNSFKQLDETKHMLKWLCPIDDPYLFIESKLENLLKQQVAEIEIEAINVIGAPDWLITKKTRRENPEKSIIARCAVAFPLEINLCVKENNPTNLEAIYTWVGIGMETSVTPRQQTWLDIKGSMKEFGSSGKLMQRIYFEDTS